MRFFLFKYIIRKPVKMLLVFFLFTAISVAVTIGIRLIYAAYESNNEINSNFTTVIQPDRGMIRELSSGREVLESLSGLTPEEIINVQIDLHNRQNQMYTQAMLTIINNPYTIKDDRRMYFGAVDDLVPMFAPSPTPDPRFMSEELQSKGAASLNPANNASYRQTMLDVICEKVIDNSYNDSYSYYLRVNVAIMHHAEHSYIPDYFDAYYSYTLNGQPIMEEGGRYLIVGDNQYPNTYQGDTGGITLCSPYDESKKFITEPSEFNTVLTDDLLLPCVRVDDLTLLDFTSEDAFYASSGLRKELATRWYEIYTNCRGIVSSLSVVTTNNLYSITTFNTHKAHMVDGNAFSADDYANGELVCIISAELAEAIGLKVGDMLNFQFRDILFSVYLGDTGAGSYPIDCNPLLSFKVAEDTYRIIGIYQSAGWEDSDYNFSPNTVFIPAASMPLTQKDMEREDMYKTISDFIGEPYIADDRPHLLSAYTIPNHKVNEFMDSLDVDTKELILVMDQGYRYLTNILKAILKDAQFILTGSIILWLIVVLLILFVSITKIRHEIGILRSMGASRIFVVMLCLLVCFVPWCSSIVAGSIISVDLYGSIEKIVYSNAFESDEYGNGFSDSGTFSNQGENSFTKETNQSYHRMLESIDTNNNGWQALLYSLLFQAFVFFIICSIYVLLSTRKKVFFLLRQTEVS